MRPESDKNIFYVYVHKRADSGQVFYVGKGSKWCCEGKISLMALQDAPTAAAHVSGEYIIKT